MITQQDIIRLKKVFYTKVDAEEQTQVLAQTFNDIAKQLSDIKDGQEKVLEQLGSLEEFMKVMSIKLLNHDGRISTLESKILLS